uniref:Uncharacterized protein n=1 Tax=Knipowitschia caucasica TaxID=637954 RepID=A0AAV2JVF7_KNICA
MEQSLSPVPGWDSLSSADTVSLCTALSLVSRSASSRNRAIHDMSNEDVEAVVRGSHGRLIWSQSPGEWVPGARAPRPVMSCASRGQDLYCGL